MQRSAARQKLSCMLSVTCQLALASDSAAQKVMGSISTASLHFAVKSLHRLHVGIVCSLGITKSLIVLGMLSLLWGFHVPLPGLHPQGIDISMRC